ncbi:hypothetical protein Pyrde_0380 [Pyrodictium delaneyi]|uniref:Uncharacterized protein n=1 Tax=Pyrodictium delaneyi TaxID=1273541 RepID=A0A0P0N1H0_9CREN|nr:hypothetical protein Pyrde_0380 [Pyrodictium delaneyi]
MLVSRLAALQGALTFLALISILAVATAPTSILLTRAVEFWIAASVLSAISTWLLARHYAAALSQTLSTVSNLSVKRLGPRGATEAETVAQSIAGLEQIASLWPLAAAGLGVTGLVTTILSYYMARRGCQALIQLAEQLGVEPPCKSLPGLSVAATSALGLAGLGLTMLFVAPSYGRLMNCIKNAGEALEEQLRGPAASEHAGEPRSEEAVGDETVHKTH